MSIGMLLKPPTPLTLPPVSCASSPLMVELPKSASSVRKQLVPALLQSSGRSTIHSADVRALLSSYFGPSLPTNLHKSAPRLAAIPRTGTASTPVAKASCEDFHKTFPRKRLLASRGGDLGFAVQLGTVRFLGTFLSPDPLDVPWNVVDYLVGQLGIADPSVVKRYTDRRMTAYEHAWEIRRAYGYRDFADEQASLAGPAEEHLRDLARSLDTAWREMARRLAAAGPEASVRIVPAEGDRVRLSVERLDAVGEP